MLSNRRCKPHSDRYRTPVINLTPPASAIPAWRGAERLAIEQPLIAYALAPEQRHQSNGTRTTRFYICIATTEIGLAEAINTTGKQRTQCPTAWCNFMR